MIGLRTGIKLGPRVGLAVGASGNELTAATYAGPTYQAVGSVVPGTAGLTVAWPAHASGDYAYLVVVSHDIATMTAHTLATAAGFTSVGSVEASVSGHFVRLTVFECRASSGAMTSPITNAKGLRALGYIITVRGAVAAGSATDAFQTSAQSALDTTLAVTGTTTLGANRLVLALVGGFVSGGTSALNSPANATLGNVTERLDSVQSVSAENLYAGAVSGEATATGATGTTSGTFDGSYGIWAAMTVAVKAA